MLRKIFLSVGLILVANQTFAASPEDVAEVVGLIDDSSIPALLRSDNEVVFVHKGMRYTLWHSGERLKADDPSTAWLSVWTRKNGSAGQRTRATFSDHGFDGIVDFGIDSDQKKAFHAGTGTGPAPNGPEHREFWQQAYDKTIAAALEYKRAHSQN